uniref:Uncharacterized protein n=1 Tax=Parascaris univalens TaxID=6257 RepID=A0A915BU22_PARUN
IVNERLLVSAGLMESIKRKQEQMECSQTWTIAFAVSLVFTIVIGVLLILYCIMYRKHITFLFRGPTNKRLASREIEITQLNDTSIPEGSLTSGTSLTVGSNTTLAATTGATTTQALKDTTATTNTNLTSMVSQC